MLTEVAVAVSYIVSHLYCKLPRRRVDDFAAALDACLKAKLQSHWDPTEPFRGVQYRCVRVTGEHPDEVIFQAAQHCGLLVEEIFSCLPPNLTVWIDPGEVTYRLGAKGQIQVLLEREGSSANSAGESGSVSPVSFPQLSFNQSQQQMQDLQLHCSGLTPLSPTLSPQPVSGPAHPMYLLKSASNPSFTAATFAQTKFGSTKLKTPVKRPNRFSPSNELAATPDEGRSPRPQTLPSGPFPSRSLSLSPSSGPNYLPIEIPCYFPPSCHPHFPGGYLTIQIPPAPPSYSVHSGDTVENSGESSPIMANHDSFLMAN